MRAKKVVDNYFDGANRFIKGYKTFDKSIFLNNENRVPIFGYPIIIVYILLINWTVEPHFKFF